jgi:general secretion pathway protein H
MHHTRLARGFTLVEMLVVVVIIGMMAVGALLALGVVGRDRTLETETRRIEALLDHAREMAELQTRDYGLRVTRGGYDFVVFEPRSGQWTLVIDDALRPRRLPAGLTLELELEGRRVVLAETAGKLAPVPQVGMQSGGEYTPFALTLRRAGTTARQTLRTLEDGTLQRDELLEDGAP